MYLLGIDIGTSACKVALFERDGNVVASGNGEYQVYYPHPGWAEQDPEEWWNAVCKTILTVLQKNHIDASLIDGIGIDGQSWSAIAIDQNGKVLCNTPIWMDTRATEICERYNKLIGEDEIFSLCGNSLQPSYTTPKIIWYRENRPEVYEKTYKILQSNSYIGYRLTKNITMDISQGYGFHCFDMKKGIWDDRMCEAFGIPRDLLPDIVACHQVIGTVTKEAARQTGLQEGTKVVAGGLDAACGALGAGVYKSGQTQEQGGQAGGMSICEDTPIAHKKLILGTHVVPGLWLLQGGTVGGGGTLNWFRREFGKGQSFDELTKPAEKIPAGSDGVLFLPYMAGERSPIWNPDAKGVFYGLSFDKTKGHMVRAVMEGVAFSLEHNLMTAKEVGANVESLYAMGGSANSILWTQIKADVTGKTIYVPTSDTATTLGAAILAGVGCGIYASFEEAVIKTIKITRVQHPDESRTKIYTHAMKEYLKLYDHLKDMMKS